MDQGITGQEHCQRRRHSTVHKRIKRSYSHYIGNPHSSPQNRPEQIRKLMRPDLSPFAVGQQYHCHNAAGHIAESLNIALSAGTGLGSLIDQAEHEKAEGIYYPLP